MAELASYPKSNCLLISIKVAEALVNDAKAKEKKALRKKRKR